ncbi:MAG: metallophosphoesterase [Cyanobium sp.]
MRLLQLSDPHLLADPQGICRGRAPCDQWQHALVQADRQLQAAGLAVDQLLISGDLCQDESWGGYLRLAERLDASPLAALPAPWLLPGNHDHAGLLRAALGRRMVIAPAQLQRGVWRILLLDSHLPGRLEGRLGERQLAWLGDALAREPLQPTLVVLHHPPLPIGEAGLDAIALSDGEALRALLAPLPGLRAVLFGHVHQHWHGWLPQRPATLVPVPLLGCPSTLRSFAAVQPCPLDRAEDPGGRWLALQADGTLQQRLLRWSAAPTPC